MDPERVERIRKLGASWIGDENQALVLLAARRGVVFLHEAFGRLRPEPDSPPVRTDSIFPLSSISKPITATCAMALVDDGLLDLNRPVQYYLPEFTGEGKAAVAIRHLLTHTSGLDDAAIREHQAKVADTRETPPPEQTQHPVVSRFLHLSYDAPLSRPPGEAEVYCNAGFALIGEIARRVSGKSLTDFAEERVFEPLGMKETNYFLPESQRPRLVRRPDGAPGARIPHPVFDMGLNGTLSGTVPWGYSGVHSTAHDMAVFGQMFLNAGAYGGARILSAAAVREMTSNQTPGIGSEFLEWKFPEVSIGYGWMIPGKSKTPFITPTLFSPGTFGHAGLGGIILWVDPVAEVVAVYFSVCLQMFQGAFQLRNTDLSMNALYAGIR